MPCNVFPYNRFEERFTGYQEGSERFDVDYIAREAHLLMHWLAARLKRHQSVKSKQFSQNLTDRDARILWRWGLR